MGLSEVIVNVGQNGLGRRPLNKDKISGILFYWGPTPDELPVGTIKKVFSLADAEALGIIDTGGTAVQHYHISEYFRGNPEGELWVGYGDPVDLTGGDFQAMTDMIIASGGETRQLGIYCQDVPFVSTMATAVQAAIDALPDAYKQLSVLIAGDFQGQDMAEITDLRTLTARKVSVVIAEDKEGVGGGLATVNGYSTTCLGLALGQTSRASVEQSIGNPQNFQLSNGEEMEVPALADGVAISGLAPALLGSLKDKGYLIARSYLPDLTGSFFERCPTAIAATNDFAFIENNRTVDKAIRLVRAALIPQLNSNVPVMSDGRLRPDITGYFHDLAQTPLTQMEADGEISASNVKIDPDQDILGTSTLEVTIEIVPVGIAEKIVVNISLTTKTTP